MAFLGKAASQQDPLEESDRLRQLKTVEELCTAEHPYAANRILEVVRKMFNWGKVAGLVPRDHANPAVGIVRFRERKRKRFITTMEMPRFINALEQEDNDYARHGIWLLVLMGVRSNELLKAKWILPLRKSELSRLLAVRRSEPVPGSPPEGGPAGIGIEWRMVIVSSPTRTSLTRRRTIRWRSAMSSVCAEECSRVMNVDSVSVNRK
jgi:hypothetical protein